jgi:hypothetical protein
MRLDRDTRDRGECNGVRWQVGYRGRALLLAVHLLVCCASLVCVALDLPDYHIAFSPDYLLTAVLTVLAFASIAILFTTAEFSFGYAVGFYLYTMILGYLWLNSFSEFGYNHKLSGLSAAVSGALFLLPALYRAPLPQILVLPQKTFDRLLTGIVLLGAATAAIGARYNFRLVSFDEIYYFRDALTSPTAVNYLTGITTTALLPFAFACYALRGNFGRASVVLLLLLVFYPITLSKQALIAPLWLVVVLVATKFLGLRLTVILSLLAPMLIGIVLFVLFWFGLAPPKPALAYFLLVNFRTVAIPSLAMDYYSNFFFAHDITSFCQISLLKPFMSCPYQEPLSVVIYKFYGIGGNFNASLFATEGVASVGPLLAPLSALLCGLVIALANALSGGLPQRLVLVSGALLPQAFLNVPFTTVLLSHGAGLLFLLWYVMPRPSRDAVAGPSERVTRPVIPGNIVEAKP